MKMEFFLKAQLFQKHAFNFPSWRDVKSWKFCVEKQDSGYFSHLRVASIAQVAY